MIPVGEAALSHPPVRSHDAKWALVAPGQEEHGLIIHLIQQNSSLLTLGDPAAPVNHMSHVHAGEQRGRMRGVEGESSDPGSWAQGGTGLVPDAQDFLVLRVLQYAGLCMCRGVAPSRRSQAPKQGANMLSYLPNYSKTNECKQR